MGQAGPKVANCSKKRTQTKDSRQNGPRVLFISWQVTGLRSNAGSAFERTSLFVVERRVYGRPQITAKVARADRACVQPLLLRATVGVFERTKCGRTHFGRNPLLHFKSTLPIASHVLLQ
jgi:hypothetical protein